MKEGIHPTFYADAIVVCGSCGTTWHTGSTKKEVHLDICSNCHPFFTGTQRIVDTAGQVERFSKRLAARETLAPEGEARLSKKQRRAAERAKRSGVPEEPETPVAPEAVAEAAPVAEAPVSEAAAGTTAEAPASAPRERKPRPPRERKPREPKPETEAPAASEATAPTASESAGESAN